MYDRRLVVLTLLMIIVSLSVGGTAIALLYQTALEQEKARLIETARSQARLMEAVARFDTQYSQTDVPGGAAAATLSQIKDAHAHHKGFGKTGAFAIGKKEGNQIIFLDVYQGGEKINIPSVPMEGKLAVPMQKALSGHSGAMIGLDYRNEIVLAAYEPISILNLGIVVKIDLAEMREPFIETGFIVLAIAFIIIVAGSLLFFRIGNPILEKIRAQNKTLREAQDRLSKAQEIAHLGNWCWTINNNNFEWSDEIYRIFGFTPKQFIPTYDDFLKAVHIDDREKLEAAISSTLANIQPYDIEHRIVQPDGTERIVHELGEVQLDKDGMPHSMVGIIQDITARKIAEKALKESEYTVRLLLNSAAEAIYGMNLEGECTFANPACINMLGYNNVDELLGKNMHELTHYAYPDGSIYPLDKCLIRQALKENCGTHVDNEVLWKKDGSSFPAEYWSHPMHQEGRIIGLVVTFLDITERKEVELELQKSKEAADAANQAKSQFLASMSHEIRTPINAIIGIADHLKQIKLDTQNSQLVSVLNKSANGLLELINDVLDLAKIEAGQMIVEETICDLSVLIHDAVGIMEFTANKKGIKLNKEIDPLIPNQITCDPKCIRQVLLNILGNAIKFTNKGTINITVTPYEEADRKYLNTEALSGDRGYFICFSIEDTGIGIAPNKIDMIFNRFSQADESIARSYGGTGLGLTISKNMVQMMGGKIWVESVLGKGSTFHFTIYCRPNTPSLTEEDKTLAANTTPAIEHVDSDHNKPLNILIAEDSEDNIMLVKLYLKETPFQIDFVENGEFAVQQRKKKDYDLILMDMQMPIKDGYTATSEIRAWEENTGKNQIPIIAVTANALKSEEQKCFAAGCTGYLSKPFKKNELMKIIESYS